MASGTNDRSRDGSRLICTCPVAAIDAMGEADLTDSRCPLHGEDLSHDYLKRVASKRRADDERLGTPPLEKFAYVWQGWQPHSFPSPGAVRRGAQF